MIRSIKKDIKLKSFVVVLVVFIVVVVVVVVDFFKYALARFLPVSLSLQQASRLNREKNVKKEMI